jgi:hypothetical protein
MQPIQEADFCGHFVPHLTAQYGAPVPVPLWIWGPSITSVPLPLYESDLGTPFSEHTVPTLQINLIDNKIYDHQR